MNNCVNDVKLKKQEYHIEHSAYFDAQVYIRLAKSKNSKYTVEKEELKWQEEVY